MALKGLDIFKFLPKSNCKKCGSPTCMAFAMKVAQGGIELSKCPDISQDALDQLSEASAPPMKSITIGAGGKEYKLGGETVLFRHDKTFVSKSLYGVNVCQGCIDEKLPEIAQIDYERIGERMIVDVINVQYKGDKAKYLETVKKAAGAARTLILECHDPDTAKEALELVKAEKPVLNGANESNWEVLSKIATDAGVVLGVCGKTLDSLYDTIVKLEGAGNKNLILDITGADPKETFANAVQVRRAALKDGDRTFGYPSLINLGNIVDDETQQLGLASIFTLKYGSIIIMSGMKYCQALPLYGLRQNIYTDPQKPMKMEPKIYPINGADENAVCAVSVDFALTYFVVTGELERSGVPVNFIVTDAGGYSVLTSWAAGKFSASSIAKFFKDADIEGKIKNRTLILPGKVAVLKGELEETLQGWKVLVGPNEAVGLVKYLKDLKA